MTQRNGCKCPRIDGYVIPSGSCPHHEDLRARRRAMQGESDNAATPAAVVDPEAEELACAWSDYRGDYGVLPDHMTSAYKAFRAGWKAAREGDQSGVLR